MTVFPIQLSKPLKEVILYL